MRDKKGKMLGSWTKFILCLCFYEHVVKQWHKQRKDNNNSWSQSSHVNVRCSTSIRISNQGLTIQKKKGLHFVKLCLPPLKQSIFYSFPLKLCRWRLPPPPLCSSFPFPPPYCNKFWLVPRPSNFSPFVYTSDRKKSLVHIAWELALCEVDHQILKAPYNGCSCGPQPKVICRRGIFFA